MADTTFVTNVTVIPADWLNEINDFYHTMFGATGGLVCIGDTANSKMTVGLTINQLGNDNEILALKSSDIAHGMSDETETDTFLASVKLDATSGGAFLKGFSESSSGIALGGFHTTDITTKTTSSYGAVRAIGYLKTGTSVTTMGADANIMSVESNGISKFLFSNSGYMYAQGGLAIVDGVTAPSTVTGFAMIYVDTADGDLKIKFGDGTVKTITVDT